MVSFINRAYDLWTAEHAELLVVVSVERHV